MKWNKCYYCVRWPVECATLLLNNQESLITQNQNSPYTLLTTSTVYPENMHFMEDVSPLAFNKILIMLSKNWKGFQFLMLIKLGLSRTY